MHSEKTYPEYEGTESHVLGFVRMRGRIVGYKCASKVLAEEKQKRTVAGVGVGGEQEIAQKSVPNSFFKSSGKPFPLPL